MGTNFYLRRTKPREVYDEYHIAKTSYGWEPGFEAHDGYGDEPTYNSVADIRRLIESGDYTVVDEYGEEYSLSQFEEDVCKFNGHPFGTELRTRDEYGGYRDPEGYHFTRTEFC